MSVVAIKGIPKIWDLRRLVINIANCIRRQFEGLGFSDLKGNTKTGYIKLPKGSKPGAVINLITKKKFKDHHMVYTFRASVANNPPNFKNQAQVIPSKTQKHVMRQFRKQSTAQRSPGEALMVTHDGLYTEMQSVYTELYALSLEKTGHQLLTNISQIIFDRLLKLLINKTSDIPSAFELSKVYRRMHPHNTDFNLIVTTLHSIQDASGIPRTQLSQSDLIRVHREFLVNNVPMAETDAILQKCSDRIMNKVRDYLATVQDEVNFNYWSEEESASKRVKEELLKMPIQIEGIVEDVMFTHFKTRALRLRDPMRILMYGIPYLPSKEGRQPILNQHAAHHKARGDLYNLMIFTIARQHYNSLMEYDGQVVEGAVLHIRNKDAPFFKVPCEKHNAMQKAIKDAL